MPRPAIALVLVAASALALAAPAGANLMPRAAGAAVYAAPCPDQSVKNGGCAYSDGRVYVDTTEEFTLAHEHGHAFAFLVMTDGDRAWFAKRLGRKQWTETTGELFADAYGFCERDDINRDGDGSLPSGYGYNATPKRHAGTCRAIIRVAKRNPGKVAQAPRKGLTP